ncbi:DSD1 family PLP-dependent enzyme [Spongiibacter nanhainus]|uniref:DSD1 family PLP-dependent enzyme n=1 Tax=Spongiibacter nanhainus TaxID=2794344 RepID=A0A7T4QZ19_9GAMM|nr:DSD1 family PLP-dependent enzyme [Spongiibacter nanhainus]QQD17267.1 DSD1 family PLP-dependent enzyme [Spongiibacter nanhainus]
MKRRNLLLGGLGLGIGGTWLARPSIEGDGKHSAYFQQLNSLLHRENLARPTMIVDLDRLDHNIAEVRRHIPNDKTYRVVAKSLPAQGLIDYAMAKADTSRLMVFHQPFLNHFVESKPDSDLLVGKPMPIGAAARFYQHYQANAFDVGQQLQWLIDTPQRLKQYAQLAEAQQLPMRINIEVDIGLHRGGVKDPAVLAGMLKQIDAHPYLTFSGLMGYDPHVSKAPAILGMQEREGAMAQHRYHEFMEVWRRHNGGDGRSNALTLNAAGSPTFHRWYDNDTANDLSAGSALLKPLDFDIPTLANHQPALFIGTPILKVSDGIEMPIAPLIGQAQTGWNPNRRKTLFVYGGYWKAEPVSPPGLLTNPTYGRSTNQEMLNSNAQLQLGVDDYVFYRPTQSEFVMLQFGDIIAVRGGQIEAVWPVLPQGA